MNERRYRHILLLTIGSVAGIFVLLFGMVNDDWLVIAFPGAPWSDRMSWPVFESRAWAVMLVCYCFGGVTGWIFWRMARSKLVRKSIEDEGRIQSLEREIEKTNRLLCSTRKAR